MTKETIEGIVKDHVLDCSHLVVLMDDYDVLHNTLGLFENKHVRITIEEIGSNE